MNLKTEDASYANGETTKTKSIRIQAVPQVIAVTIKNILLVSFGLTLGFPTILIPGLSDPEEPFNLDAEGLSWIGSMNLICVPIGCLLSGAISQALGRRRAMQVVNIPFVIAWLLFRFSNAEWQVFAALALTGLSGGFLEAPVLTYVAEISQPHLRGMLSSTSSMAVILGVLLMFIFGTCFPWRTVALISCIFNVFSFNLLFFVPESPHWLISKNRLLDARKSIAWFRGWTSLEEIEPEYKQIYREVRASELQGVDNLAFDGNMNGSTKTDKPEKHKKSILDTMKLYTEKKFLWPYAIVFFTFYLTHFTGMTNLQTYAVAIFSSLRSPIDKYYATVILGVSELIGTIVCVIVVHYTGKRLLNFVSLIGMGICFTVVATYAYMIDVRNITIMTKNSTLSIDNEMIDDTNNYSWIPLVFLVGYAFIAHMGIRVLPWILTGEVFSNETRAAAAGICAATSYILSFICNKVFFSMVSSFTLPGMFWFNAATAFLGVIVLYFILPETEGKTLGQVNEHFAGGKKMGNDVFRGIAKEEPIHLGTINNAYINDNNRIESKL